VNLGPVRLPSGEVICSSNKSAGSSPQTTAVGLLACCIDGPLALRFLDNLNERRLLFFIRMQHRFVTMGAHF
jgi:hypothetical protein